jgi:hypothetical protein
MKCLAAASLIDPANDVAHCGEPNADRRQYRARRSASERQRGGKAREKGAPVPVCRPPVTNRAHYRAI